jgi:hypothetical protein
MSRPEVPDLLIARPGPSKRRNTPLARKREHLRLQRTLAADLGLHNLTSTERTWLSMLATLTMRASMLQASIELGEVAAKRMAEVTKTSSEARRVYLLLKACAAANAEAKAPSLSTYLASLAAKRDQRSTSADCEALDNVETLDNVESDDDAAE